MIRVPVRSDFGFCPPQISAISALKCDRLQKSSGDIGRLQGLSLIRVKKSMGGPIV